jgi:hypothetical protein
MSRTRQKKGPENTPVKTAIPASYAAMTAAGYASAKNPVAAKNQRKTSLRLRPNWNA